MPSWLTIRLRGHADKPALAGPWGVRTYAELLALVDKASAALRQLALDQPTAFAIVGEHGPASVAWLLALGDAGHIVAPLAGGAAEHPPKLARIHAQWVVSTHGDDYSLLPRVDEPSAHPLFERLRAQGRAGLVLFSSGTSGRPKAMVHDLAALLSAYEARHPSRLPVLALLGFDHIGGLNTLFGCLASGSLLVVPSDRSPGEVAAAMARHRVAVLPASPTFLGLLLASGEHRRHDLSALRLISYGTEPMSEALLARAREAFPGVRFLQTFGTSETGIARTESPDPASTFVRFDDPALEWKVVADELWLRSRTQIIGYLGGEGDRFTDDGWFRTGDKVESGPNGTLRVIGRFGEMINVGGEKLMPAEVEAVILAVPAVVDCRVRGEAHALTGQTVAAEVVAADGADPEALRASIRTACRRRLSAYKVPTRVTFVATVSGDRLKKLRAEPRR